MYKTLPVSSLHEFISQDIYRDKQICTLLPGPVVRNKDTICCAQERLWTPSSYFVVEVERK